MKRELKELMIKEQQKEISLQMLRKSKLEQEKSPFSMFVQTNIDSAFTYHDASLAHNKHPFNPRLRGERESNLQLGVASDTPSLDKLPPHPLSNFSSHKLVEDHE